MKKGFQDEPALQEESPSKMIRKEIGPVKALLLAYL
jgi:hypothetical protein